MRPTDKIIEHALVTAENAGYIGEGDVVIVSAGIATNSSPTSKRGLTNTIACCNNLIVTS